MVIVDYILLAAFAISVGIGFFRGFFREALSLVNWLLALWIAWRFSGVLDPVLASVSSPALKLWLARILMFLGVLLAGALLGHLVAVLLRKSGLTGADRGLGMVFGAARGVLVVGVLVIAFQALEMDREPWWQDSVIVPKTAELTGMIREYMDAGLDRLGEAMAE
ncbi:MAG TPA: CvpA family protein [Gammaproteobacteria bacterium]|nr:CvpA family protein [Gammaproteobacteria bacterium]